MARVEWSDEADAALATLIRSHSLPADTRARLRNSLQGLTRFPRMGVEIPHPGADLRFVLGPWRWLVVIYVYFGDEDRGVVVTVEDGRASTPIASRRRRQR